MKILKPGGTPSDTAAFDCPYCECAFTADSSEYEAETDYRNGVYYKVQCPHCGKMVYGSKIVRAE